MAPSTTSPSRPHFATTKTDGGTSLILREATIPERHFSWTLNSSSWRGPLTENAYYLRESHLGAQDLTREGGIQYWVLVADNDTDSRTDTEGHKLPNILSACETIRKSSMIFKAGGKTEKVVSYGIGGVFTSEDNRGKGYARMMLGLLAERLKEFGFEGKRCGFSVLYSDIGKKFYSSLGWNPHPSSHVAFPATKSTQISSEDSRLKLLRSSDLENLCRIDCEALVEHGKNTPLDQYTDARALQFPDRQTMAWHHSREEFVGQYTCGRLPEIKGAWAAVGSNTQVENGVWAIWCHDFTDEKLVILRLHVPPLHSKNLDEVREALASILKVAAAEAGNWNFKEVQAWNPQDILLKTVERVFGKQGTVDEGRWEVVDREETSVCSLMWYDEDGRHGEIEPSGIEWFANEKFGWC